MPRLLLVALFTLASSASAQLARWSAHWPLNESSGTTTRDVSPNLNSGTLKNFTGTPWGAGKHGNALTFDGVDDYVEVIPRRALPIYDGKGSAYTVAFWVKAPKQNDKRCYAEGSSMASTGFGALFTLGTGRQTSFTDDRLQVFIRNDSNTNVINWQSNAVVFDDTWHHVAWVDVAGKGQLYVDGVADTRNWDYTGVAISPRTKGYGKFTTDRVSLGAVLRGSACCYLKGSLDDVRVYRFALTVADVKSIMNNGPHPQCAASIAKFGYGCGAGPLAFNATGSAQFGKSFAVQLTRGPANAPALLLVGGPIEPIDLNAIYPGCAVYPPLAASIPGVIGVLDSSGASAAVRIAVPNDATLGCVEISIQGIALSGSPIVPQFSDVLIPQLGR